jgi:hypothetical protein
MWMRSPATAPSDPQGSRPQPPGGGPLPALAGGSPELDEESSIRTPRTLLRPAHPEVALVALLAGAGTLFFGIVPQPLFDLVRHAGAALPGLF